MWQTIKEIFYGVLAFVILIIYMIVFAICFIFYALLFKFINREKKDTRTIDV